MLLYENFQEFEDNFISMCRYWRSKFPFMIFIWTIWVTPRVFLSEKFGRISAKEMSELKRRILNRVHDM